MFYKQAAMLELLGRQVLMSIAVSHCLHCVMVKGRNMNNGECIRSKLWLIDLAGSERIAKTDVQGERLKEAQNINKSLSALGDVISALATKSPHIPFRNSKNSKLTHLLQDSLGGDSKALMFLQISISENDVNETLCSLNFASRVRGIELGPAKKQFDGSEILKYKQMLEKAKQDSKGKDITLKKREDIIHSMDTKMKAKETSNKILQDKVKELELRLIIERNLARQQDSNNGRLPLEPRENFPLMKENKLVVNEEVTVMSRKEVSGGSKLDDKTIPLMPKRINRLSLCPHKLDNNTSSLMPRRINMLSICPDRITVIAPNSGRKSSVGRGDDALRSSSPPGVVKQQPHRNILRRSLQKKFVVLRPQQQ